MILKIVIIYWILSTIVGIVWVIKHPSFGDDKECFTAAEVIGHIFPCALLSWILLPIGILESIKFKR